MCESVYLMCVCVCVCVCVRVCVRVCVGACVWVYVCGGFMFVGGLCLWGDYVCGFKETHFNITSLLVYKALKKVNKKTMKWT